MSYSKEICIVLQYIIHPHLYIYFTFNLQNDLQLCYILHVTATSNYSWFQYWFLWWNSSSLYFVMNFILAYDCLYYWNISRYPYSYSVISTVQIPCNLQASSSHFIIQLQRHFSCPMAVQSPSIVIISITYTYPGSVWP